MHVVRKKTTHQNQCQWWYTALNTDQNPDARKPLMGYFHTIIPRTATALVSGAAVL